MSHPVLAYLSPCRFKRRLCLPWPSENVYIRLLTVLLALVFALRLTPGAGAQGEPQIFIGNDAGNNTNFTILRVQQSDGSLISSAATPTYRQNNVNYPAVPARLTLGPDGNIYMVDRFEYTLFRFSGTTGSLINTYTYPPSRGLLSFKSICFGLDANIYIGTSALGVSSGILQIKGPATTQLGTSNGYFGDRSNQIYSMAFDTVGNMYAAKSDAIEVFSPTGTLLNANFITTATAGTTGGYVASALAIGPDANLYALDVYGQVHKYDIVTGASLGTLTLPSDLGSLNDMAIGPDKNLYLATSRMGVVRFDLNGNYLGVFVPLSANLINPISLAFGPAYPQNFAVQVPFKETGASVWLQGATGAANLGYSYLSSWNVSGSAGGYRDVKTPDVRINLGPFGSYTIPGVSLGSFGGAVSASTHGNYGLSLTTQASSGSVDVNYPVQITMIFPDRSTLFANQWFNVYTGAETAAAANMSTTSPIFKARLDVILNGAFNASANARAFGRDIYNSLIQVPAGFFNSSAFLPSPNINGNFNYDRNVVDTEALLGNRTIASLTAEDLQGQVKFPVIQTAGAPNAFASDPRVITTSGQDAFLTMRGNVSNLLRNSVGGDIPIGSVSLNSAGNEFTSTTSLANFVVTKAHFNVVQDFRFAPMPHVKLQLPAGQTVNWRDKNGTQYNAVNSLEFDAGDTIQIQLPTSLILNFTATYSLPNTFSHILSLGVESNWVFTPFEIKSSGSYNGYSLGAFDFHPAPNLAGPGNLKQPLYQAIFPLNFNSVPQQITVSGSTQPAPKLARAIPSQIPLVIVPFSTANTLPNSVVSGTTTIIVSGSGFAASGNQAYFSLYGSAPIPVPTTLLTPYSLQVRLPNKYLLMAGTGQLYTTAGSSGNSNSLDISIVNPVPAIRTISPAIYAENPADGGNLVTVADANDARDNPTFLWGPTYYTTVQNQWQTSFGTSMAATFPGYNFSTTTPVATIHFVGSDGMDNTLGAYQESLASGKLMGSLPPTLYGKPDTAQITIVSPEPGGGTSNTLSLTINSSGPQITDLSPSVVTPGSGAFRLQVTGPSSISTNSPGNFNKASVVCWDGEALPTTFVSSGSLYADVPAASTEAAGNHSVKVVTNILDGQGGSSSANSNVVTLSVRYPAPAIAESTATPPGLSPAAIVSADKAFVGTDGAAIYNLTVNGAGFGSGSAVLWNGIALATQYVSPTQLTATVPYVSVTLPGTATITVSSPTANGGGGLSNPATFTITNAMPGDTVRTALKATALTTGTGTVLTTLDSDGNITLPGSLMAGNGETALVVQGEGFYSGSVVSVNGSPRATTFTAHNALSVTLNAADLAAGGTAAITVTNPAPGGGTTASLPLVIASSPPTAALAGAALDFNGTDAYAQTPSGVYFNGDFTIEGWVYYRSYASWSRLLDFGNGGNTDDVAFGLAFESGIPFLGIDGANVFSSQVLPLNTWTHLAATLSGSTVTIYIDGVPAGTGTLDVPENHIRQNCFIARSNYNADAYANAQFDEIRIWSKARSQADILADRNASLQGNEAGLLAYYRMDEGNGSATLADATGNGHTATLINGPTWAASGAPIDTVHALAGVPRPITLAGFDPGSPARPLTFAIASNPTRGAFTGGSSPTFTYTPGADYTGTDNGTDTFTYTASRNGSAASAPTTVHITTSSAYSAGDGLYAQYYSGYDPASTFEGLTPFLQTVDPTINFQVDSLQWGVTFDPSPWDTGVPHDNFTVRWTGKLLAPVTGDYTFTTISDDGSMLSINGVQVVNNNFLQPPTARSSAPVFLVAGQLYTIEMDFGQYYGGASAQLLWQYPGQSQQIIPQANLFSGQPQGAWVSGKLDFEGIAETAPAQNVTFTFRPTDGTPAFDRTLVVPASGVFSLSGLPQKDYTLHIKGERHLAVNLTANAASANVTGLTGLLRAGDSNNDNSADALDLADLISAFNLSLGDEGYNPAADFNGDDSNDALDLALLITNFNTEGAP